MDVISLIPTTWESLEHEINKKTDHNTAIMISICEHESHRVLKKQTVPSYHVDSFLELPLCNSSMNICVPANIET